ncbi:hypothetical protein DAEQUDRAFT_726394 [Daedalea quercina L-15889]|uniref:Tat pathway signal sequence n=1 Tax=Daedalea quercina L-15889 TaxID=1314783 RepID=A0A165QNX5_9APHY|nr:hypothetical protein DAEQUDRAFT_726394 [Daedalea quercina L-15889]
MPSSDVRYVPIPEADDSDGQGSLKLETLSVLGCDSPPNLSQRCYSSKRNFYDYWPILAGATFFSASLVLFYLSLHNPDVQCTRRLSTYSPAIEAVEYHDVMFNGSLHHTSEFRGTPSPEVDAAWDRISNLKPLSIFEDDLTKIGRNSRPSMVKYHEAFSGGYVATIEIAHHMHCLNMLRKRTYWDYYAPLDDSYQRNPDFYRVHLDHCIELLRQSLMCTADVGLITFDWVAEHRNPWPNFSTQHRCRNFDKLVEWNEAHSVSINADNLTRTDDAVDLPEGP